MDKKNDTTPTNTNYRGDMDCIGWQSKGRLWVLQLCGGNREQNPMEGKRSIPGKLQSNRILTHRQLQGANSYLLR
eukprot:11304670-Ditylum_brightwellii.AAC.1